MSGRDPFELLSELNPFVDEFGGFGDADEALLLRILETPVTATQTKEPVGSRESAVSRARGRGPWVIGGVVALVVLSTAAFAVLRRDRASDPTGVLCYATADVDAGDRAVLPPSDDPVAACAVPWSDGTFSRAGAPALVGCVNDAGVATVFPGDPSVCSQLGLAELEPGRTVEQQAVVDLGDRLIDAFTNECVDQDDAVPVAQGLLDASGLEGWTVQLAEDFPHGLECGIATPLPDTRTVIVGGARPAP